MQDLIKRCPCGVSTDVDCVEFYDNLLDLVEKAIKEKKTCLTYDEARKLYPHWYATISDYLVVHGGANMASAFEMELDKMSGLVRIKELATYRRDLCRERRKAFELQNEYNIKQNKLGHWGLIIASISLIFSLLSWLQNLLTHL